MSDYGFKRPGGDTTAKGDLDLSGIDRRPLRVDPGREADAIARGASIGFVERASGEGGNDTTRRRRQAVPQANLFIKGPKDIIDWFVEFTNERGHRAYWQSLEELRALVEQDARDA